MRNGRLSTLNIMESRKTENVVLLSDILEDEVDQKYFLSKEQTERIIFAEPLDTAKCIGKTDSSWIGTGSPNPLTQEQGGGRGLHTIEVIGYTRSCGQSDEAHSLNCTDQRKVFGAHQKRTMVGYNATLKRGGGMTETALALNARDYKGLSGSSQMMTAAAMLIEDDT